MDEDAEPIKDLEDSLFRYERLLDQFFWDEDAPRLLFVEGEFGCGKSTLVDYYLRSYCPHRGRRPYDFAQKLIISINFRSADSEAAFDRRFFERCREIIRSACRKKDFDIEQHDSFAMWDSLYQWGSGVAHTARGTKPDALYRAEVVIAARASITAEVWVHAALSYLAKLAKVDAPSCPFPYIVLVLDNLDQSPLEVQRYAVTKAREIVDESTWSIWRVLIPVWYSTLAILNDSLNPFPPHREIRIGAVDTTKLFSIRTSRLQTDIIHGDDQAAAPEKEYLSYCVEHAHKHFRNCVDDLAGVSARRKLNLWRNALSSVSLYNQFDRLHGDDRQLITSYVMFDAMLTGERRTHWSLHPIFNLFCLLSDAEDSRSLLLGSHLLCMLSQANNSIEALVGAMSVFGYDREHITRGIMRFNSAGLVSLQSHQTPQPFRLNRTVVTGYETLLTTPAYLDNMALVTPVAPKRLSRMKLTHAYERSSFRDRFETTCEFLSQMRSDELHFCETVPQPQGANGYRIPRISKRACESYRARIRGLKDRGFLSDVVEEPEWDRLVNAEVFLQAERDEVYLRFGQSDLSH